MPRKASKPKNPDVMDTMDILDAKTLDSLTTKLIEALTPTFRQMLKDEFELFKAEIHESLMKATAEKVENRCGALDEQVKCLKEENLSLRRQLNAVEQVTYQSILLVQGLPENTQDASKVGLRRNPADEAAFIDLVNDRMEVDLTCNDILDMYRITVKDKKRCRPMVVQFISKKVRDTVYKAKKKLSDKSDQPESPLLQKEPIYINEFLSGSCAKTYAQARMLVKKKILYRTWTADGTVFILHTDDPSSKPRRINDIDDLPKVESSSCQEVLSTMESG